METHKIQSGSGNLTLELQQVPKLLGSVTALWAPHAFVVSFKLETDAAMLRGKAEAALQKYRVHLVVANLLQTRKDVVYLVSPPRRDGFGLAQAAPGEASTLEEVRRPPEARCIEARLVEQVTLRHLSFLMAEYQGFHLQHHEPAEDVSALQAVAALRREFAELAPSRRFPLQLRQYLAQLDQHWDALTRPAMTRPRTLTQTEEEEERDYTGLVVNYGRLGLWAGLFAAAAAFLSASAATAARGRR